MEEHTKICNSCKRALPATSQYFYRFKYSKDGFKSSCKECQGGRFITKELVPSGYKRCIDCKLILPEDEQHFLKYYSKQQNKYYYKPHCIQCGKERSKKWRADNISKYKSYYLAYAKSSEGKENQRRYKEANRAKINERRKQRRNDPNYKLREREYAKKRRRNNPRKLREQCESWRERNKGHIAEYNRKYCESHKEYFRKAAEIRRSKMLSLPCSLSAQEWKEALNRFNNKCAYCGKPNASLTQDHLIPLSKGGGYTADNIIPACKSCNSSKRDREFEDWYRSKPFFEYERYQQIRHYIMEMKGVIDEQSTAKKAKARSL